MKKLLLLPVIVLSSLYAGNLFATPVKVYGSDYSINGFIDTPGNSYYDSGLSPLSDGVFGLNAWAYSSTGFFLFMQMRCHGGSPILMLLQVLRQSFHRFPR